MPIKNGIETTKELIKYNPKQKIIFVSADDSVKKEALKVGVVGFIKKPFEINTLFEIIEELSK